MIQCIGFLEEQKNKTHFACVLLVVTRNFLPANEALKSRRPMKVHKHAIKRRKMSNTFLSEFSIGHMYNHKSRLDFAIGK